MNEGLLEKIIEWAKSELDDAQTKRLGSYTHASCGYEEAQSDLAALIEEHLAGAQVLPFPRTFEFQIEDLALDNDGDALFLCGRYNVTNGVVTGFEFQDGVTYLDDDGYPTHLDREAVDAILAPTDLDVVRDAVQEWHDLEHGPQVLRP